MVFSQHYRTCLSPVRKLRPLQRLACPPQILRYRRVYGRWAYPEDGGSYRMWRQVELKVMQGRNLGNTRPVDDKNESSSSSIQLIWTSRAKYI